METEGLYCFYCTTLNKRLLMRNYSTKTRPRWKYTWWTQVKNLHRSVLTAFQANISVFTREIVA